ncbi:MAG: Inner rane component of cytoplasmic domain [Verrucomicrobiota bacterium]|jgi:hypothetical protein
MTAYLIAESGHGVPLTADAIVVGSDPTVQVPMRPETRLAPRHFELRPAFHGGHEVVSLADGDPVQVNGTPVHRGFLRDGDLLTAGRTILQYRLIAGDPALPQMPPSSRKGVPHVPHVPHAPEETSAGERLAAADEVENVSRKRRMEELMHDSQLRTLRHLQSLRGEQRLFFALGGVLMAIALGAALWCQAAWWAWYVQIAAALPIGLLAGWIVRKAGRGVTALYRALGALAGFSAVLIGFAAHASLQFGWQVDVWLAEWRERLPSLALLPMIAAAVAGWRSALRTLTDDEASALHAAAEAQRQV